MDKIGKSRKSRFNLKKEAWESINPQLKLGTKCICFTYWKEIYVTNNDNITF